MTIIAWTLFETAIGGCGMAWSKRGVVGVQLPERRDLETRARLTGRFALVREALPPPRLQRAIEQIGAHLRGEASDLSAIALDMDGVPSFHRRVYEITRGIPSGMTLTYGDVAARLGRRSAARAVGQALGRNPFAIVVPCHRVLAAGGKPGGFSANGGIETKLRLLAIEGVTTKDGLAPPPGRMAGRAL